MKRFWLVLLSLGLIAAFSTSAMAVDVKVSGEYFAAGMYVDKSSLQKDQGQSSAFYYQRLRLKTDFVAAPGLTLTVRADVMDRQWGVKRSDVPLVTANTYDSAGTRAENENIVFDWMYVTYVSKIGIFQVGYMNDYAWGTQFGDRSKPDPKIAWTGIFGPVAVGLQIVKETEKSITAVTTAPTGIDRDLDGYIAYVNYTFKMGSAGYLFRYNRNADYLAAGIMMKTYSHLPYAKVKFGPVAVEAELNYTHGYLDIINTPSRTIDSFEAYLGATADFGIAYVGGTFAFINGQDPNRDRLTGILTGGTDWNPCLVLWNNERSYQFGSLAGHADGATTSTNNTDGTVSTGMSNVWFFQGKVGVRPVDKLDINASITYANAVIKPTNTWGYNHYGTEIDVTATYKITNNLSYMLGAGYLFTGKYFKGGNADPDVIDARELQNDYLIVNKLTLTF